MARRLVREGMYYASKLGMSNGEYAFIAFQLDPFDLQRYVKSPERWFFGQFKATKDLDKEEKKEFYNAYRSMLLLVFNTQQIEKYNKFVDQMKHRMSEPPFCSNVYKGTVTFKNSTIFKFNRTVSVRFSLTLIYPCH